MVLALSSLLPAPLASEPGGVPRPGESLPKDKDCKVTEAQTSQGFKVQPALSALSEADTTPCLAVTREERRNVQSERPVTLD